jgi:hypothetical protein
MPLRDINISSMTATAQKALLAWRVLDYVGVCAGLWMLATFLQWRAGAFAVEFSSYPDESAHYITGLMIRDYIASGHLTSPLAYALNYYAHYPKVAFGMWPPLFHIIEALWTLIFTPTKVSVLLLMALITAITGVSIYYVLCRGYSRTAALAGGALFVVLPLVQVSTAAVMVDGLIALIDLLAMIYLMRYVESERTKDAILFGVCAALCMATKANGVALALLPAVVLTITWRWHLLRARGLYYAASIMLLVGAPWTVLSYRMIGRSMGNVTFAPAIIERTALAYIKVLCAALGWGLTPFCVIGIVILLVRLWRKETEFALVGALALLISVWAYHSLIGNGDERYMLAALPPMMILAVAGFAWTVGHMPLRSVPLPARAAALGTLAIGLFVATTWTVPHKSYQGFDQAAYFLLRSPEFVDGNFLVVSGARGEGAFISEVAMHDHRPGHLVLRSTKVLSRTNWYGTSYQLRYDNDQELRDCLDQAPIDAILIDMRTAQVQQDESAAALEKKVGEVLRSDPNWKLQETFPKLVNTTPWIDLYSRLGPQPSASIHLDLRYTLGRDIVVPEGDRAK